jgi:hypothetical protein
MSARKKNAAIELKKHRSAVNRTTKKTKLEQQQQQEQEQEQEQQQEQQQEHEHEDLMERRLT